MSSADDSSCRPVVTAVIVTHDGERWLPTLIAALQVSARAPDQVVCVDTGSTDSSRDLLTEAFGPVVEAPRRTGFGAAVAAGLASTLGGSHRSASDLRTATTDDPGATSSTAGPGDWLWLLHDDCAPAPDALENLLATAARDSSIAVVGCRLRSWPRARRLLEVGVSITGTGRRETGLEPGEYDQGQLGEIRTVLAVSSAGMLVRRQVWEQLGGFDPYLPLFRDDVDFGWRAARAGLRVVVSPNAVVFHAEAATRGARAIASSSANPHRADRHAALFTLLANCSAWSLPWQYLRLVVGSALRALGYLVGKLPSAASGEMSALVAVALRPDRIAAARSARRQNRRVPQRQLRGLFPPWWTPYLDGFDAVSSRLSGSVRGSVPSGRQRGSVRPASIESGVADEAVDVSAAGGAGAWVRAHMFASLLATLTVAGLVAARGLLGAGMLQGGGLLPAPGGATDWWQLFGETHHAVGLGSDLVTAPFVAALAAGATLLLGKAWLAVDLLMLLSAPLAAAGAYLAATRLVTGTVARLWIAASYALVPVLSGAVTTGHVGTVGAAVALPWLVPAALPMFDAARPAGWRPMFATGLVLAVISAFAPVAWPMAAAGVVVSAPCVAAHGLRRAIASMIGALVVPVIVLAPWSLRLVAEPRLLLTEAGIVDSQTTSVSGAAWQLAFGRLAASGAAPWWLGIGLLVAAVVAIMRRDRRIGVASGWIVIAIALATAAMLSQQSVAILGTDQFAHAWIGFPLVVAQGAAIVAVGLAGDGLVATMAAGSFGLRQPLVAALGVVVLISPIAGLAWWVVAAPHGELSRHTDASLPAYMADALASDSSRRALVLRRDGSHVTYQVIAGNGLRLGDDSVVPAGEPADVAEVVRDLLSQPQPADVRRLAELGVRFVVLPSPASPADVAALDGLAGLTRASTDVRQLAGWQVPSSAATRRDVAARFATVSSPGQPAFLSEHRDWWLVGESVVWVIALVLAAPALTTRAGIARMEP